MDPKIVYLCVYAGWGNKRGRIGLIRASVGMKTNRGTITRITDKGCVYIGEERILKPSKFLNVWHSEARKFGYPYPPAAQAFETVS